ncbi:NAD-P-binding protein [Cubamyces menziesii]|nr:NAD-P-binding protein [Cubamyces menziesii]
MPTSYAIIGASRGIGLEYVRQLAGRADTVVFAVVRSKQRSRHLDAAISGLNNVHVVEADVVDFASLQRAAQEVGAITGGKLDYLIHNAARSERSLAYRGFDDFPSMDELDADFIDAFKVNALGVVHSITAFLPLLRAGTKKTIVFISTGGADPATVIAAGVAKMVAYGTTKAAALMIMTKWALQLKPEGFTVVSIAPGLVDTTGTMDELSGTDGESKKSEANFKKGGHKIRQQTPEESVTMQLQVIDGLKLSDTGAHLPHNGKGFLD